MRTKTWTTTCGTVCVLGRNGRLRRENARWYRYSHKLRGLFSKEPSFLALVVQRVDDAVRFVNISIRPPDSDLSVG